jgi:malonate transporter MadL subunit
MVIYGVALLAACTLAGAILGDFLGLAIGVKANVGGVGIAMFLLVLARWLLMKRAMLSERTRFGVEFWGLIYIPIVVAMAAQQNVIAAIKGGPLVLIAGIAATAASFACVPLLLKLMPTRKAEAAQ